MMLALRPAIRPCGTYNGGVIVLVGIGLHIPDDLMCEQLRELSSLQDVPFYVTQCIVSQRLYDLRDVEEGNVAGVALQRSHCVLDQERMISIGGQEVCGC